MAKVYRPAQTVPENVVAFVQTSLALPFTAAALAKEFGFSRTTAKNYLHRLEKAQVVERIGRGRYIAAAGKAKGPAAPDIYDAAILTRLVHCEHPFLEFTAWSTRAMNEYLHDIRTRHALFVEGNMETLENVRGAVVHAGEVIREAQKRAKGGEKRRLGELAAYFREHRVRPFFEKRIDDYAAVFDEADVTVVLVERTSKEGTVELEHPGLGVKVRTATLEKMVVDLIGYGTKKAFPIRANQLAGAIGRMVEGVRLNCTLITRYAAHRHLDEEVHRFLAGVYELTKAPRLRPFWLKEARMREWMEGVKGAV